MQHVYGAMDEYLREHGVAAKELLQNKAYTEKLMDHYMKQSHDYMQKRYESWKNDELKKVRENNSKASDVGRGGQAPTGAPKKYSRLSDVAEDMISDLS
jgi:hypothetical protein